MKISLSGVSETMLIPFYARVYGSRKYKDKFYDDVSLEVIKKIDYNFKKFEKGKMSIWGCLARSIILDRESKKFILENPNCKCISIGCGFDTRFNRIDNQKISWYGIDFSSVINLKKNLFPINENREFYIEDNALNEAWMKKISTDENILIILEGLLIYFEEEEIKKLFNLLAKYFPKATILAEFSRPFTIKNQKYHDTVNETQAVFKWGIKKSKDIEKICHNLKFIDEWNLTKKMFSFSPIAMFFIFPLIYFVNNTIVKLEFK